MNWIEGSPPVCLTQSLRRAKSPVTMGIAAVNGASLPLLCYILGISLSSPFPLRIEKPLRTHNLWMPSRTRTWYVGNTTVSKPTSNHFFQLLVNYPIVFCKPSSQSTYVVHFREILSDHPTHHMVKEFGIWLESLLDRQCWWDEFIPTPHRNNEFPYFNILPDAWRKASVGLHF